MTRIAAAQDNLATQSASPPGYTVKAGDTLSDIAAAHGVSLNAVIAANGQIANPNLIRPGEQVNIPAGGNAGSYTVQRGDTLSAIAERFGSDVNTLAARNGIDDPDLIFPGQRLNLGGGSPGGETGGVEGTQGATPGNPGGGNGNVYEVARQYLGRNASELRSDTTDDLPMNPNVPANVCCANFVSGVLIEAGAMDPALRTDSVDQLDSNLRGAGWTQVDAGDAKPGDVVIIQGGGVSHTEIYAGNGRMIGSNNVNADGTQRISENNLSWALDHGAVILRAPGGASNEATPTDGVQGAAPTGEGTRQERIDQAIGYFEGQGWSRAQAIGIVANLDAESAMEPNINQIGGGPGYGLAQWERPRQGDFREWAGKDIRESSFAEQLEFIQWELTNTESRAGNALRGATDAGEAASIVTRLYERPADSAGEAVRRADRANDIAGR